MCRRPGQRNHRTGLFRGADETVLGDLFNSVQSLCSYDAVGDTTAMTDQNDTTHAYAYDALGRMTSDAVTLPAGNPKNVDDGVLRIETAYNDQGLVYQTTSYDAASGGWE